MKVRCINNYIFNMNTARNFNFGRVKYYRAMALNFIEMIEDIIPGNNMMMKKKKRIITWYYYFFMLL